MSLEQERGKPLCKHPYLTIQLEDNRLELMRFLQIETLRGPQVIGEG